MQELPRSRTERRPSRARIVHGAILLIPAVAVFCLRDQMAWGASYPTAWTLPISRVIDRAMGWLINTRDFGLFTFRELTRAIAWLLTWPAFLTSRG